MRIQIVYRYPLPREAEEAAGLLEATDGIGEEDARAEVIEKIPPQKMLQFVVHSVSFLDRGHYAKLIDEGQAWYQEKVGVDVSETTTDYEHIFMRNIVYFRAEMLAAVARTTTVKGIRYSAETATVAYGGIPQWEAGEIPPEWVTLDGMANDMPVELFDQWRDATRILNAGVLSSIPDFLAQRRVSSSALA